jgi:hypothetical protein
MKHLTVIVVGLLMVVAIQAQGDPRFYIQPTGGATEPLNPGDSIEVYNSEYMAGHTFSNAFFEFYHNGIYVGRVLASNSTYDVDGFGQVIGEGVLEVGQYTWADGVKVQVETVFAMQVYTWNSYNMLQVANSTVLVPSLSHWGLMVLLILIPAVMLFYRRFS